MLTALNDELRYIVRGTEVSSGTHALLRSSVTCPICGTAVEYNAAAEDPFDYFVHEDASPNCFESDRDSVEHSRAVEAVFATIYNRLTELTHEPIEIDIERHIGSRSSFIITDVRVTNPFQLNAEIFYRADDIALRRRLPVMSKNGYQTWLVFHTAGTHDVNRINGHFREISSLSVGQFNAETLEVTLGGLFSNEKIDYSKAVNVPNYLIYTT